jgi:hypothetical protein
VIFAETDWFVAAPGLALPSADAAFDVAFLGQDGGEVQGRLADYWSVPFEDARPVRAFPSYQGQSRGTLRSRRHKPVPTR